VIELDLLSPGELSLELRPVMLDHRRNGSLVVPSQVARFPLVEDGDQGDRPNSGNNA
jgi:hypothetical protein